jgi:hypothetical protein
MRLKAPLLSLIFAVTATGCATGGGAPHITIPPSSSIAPVVVAVAAPAEITISKISAHSTLIPLGINTDPKVDPVGAMQVPSVHTPLQAGYYARGGVIPGQPGPPLVVAAHVNGDGQQGLFARLAELKVGDTASVKLKDGTVLIFRVVSTGSAPKTAFPGEKVFGSKDHASAVFITCGGAFNKAKRSYDDNILIFLDKV